MTQKSKFLRSAKLAIAGVALTSSLAACGMFSDKHNCASKHNCSSKKAEKSGCSSKHSCGSKEGKAHCSSSKN